MIHRFILLFFSKGTLAVMAPSKQCPVLRAGGCLNGNQRTISRLEDQEYTVDQCRRICVVDNCVSFSVGVTNGKQRCVTYADGCEEGSSALAVSDSNMYVNSHCTDCPQHEEVDVPNNQCIKSCFPSCGTGSTCSGATGPYSCSCDTGYEHDPSTSTTSTYNCMVPDKQCPVLRAGGCLNGNTYDISRLADKVYTIADCRRICVAEGCISFSVGVTNGNQRCVTYTTGCETSAAELVVDDSNMYLNSACNDCPQHQELDVTTNQCVKTCSVTCGTGATCSGTTGPYSCSCDTGYDHDPATSTSSTYNCRIFDYQNDCPADSSTGQRARSCLQCKGSRMVGAIRLDAINLATLDAITPAGQREELQRVVKYNGNPEDGTCTPELTWDETNQVFTFAIDLGECGMTASKISRTENGVQVS